VSGHYENTHFFEPLKQILDRVLGRGPLARKLAAAEIWTIWEAAVGAKVAKHARPVRLENGVLLVDVDSPAWHHQLHLLERHLIQELNARLTEEKVKKVRLRVAKV